MIPYLLQYLNRNREGVIQMSELHDLKSKINKTIYNINRDHFLLIEEMLSDGDDLHNRVLKQIHSLKNELSKLNK